MTLVTEPRNNSGLFCLHFVFDLFKFGVKYDAYCSFYVLDQEERIHFENSTIFLVRLTIEEVVIEADSIRALDPLSEVKV